MEPFEQRFEAAAFDTWRPQSYTGEPRKPISIDFAMTDASADTAPSILELDFLVPASLVGAICGHQNLSP